MDILSGSYSGDGLKEMAGLFQVLWGQETGNGFKKAEPLKGTDGKFLIIQADKSEQDATIARICTRPTAVDFDADGDLDLVVGNFGGTYYLFKGEGKGKFSPKSELIKRDGKALNTGHHSDPCFVDFDGDGDLDLLAGASNGGVSMVENTAGKGKAITFGKTTVLAAAPSGYNEFWSDGEKNKPSGSTRVNVGDLNGDGKLDLLVGDQTTLMTLKDGQTKEDAQKALAEKQTKIDAIGKEVQQAQESGDQEKAGKLMQQLNQHFRAKREVTDRKVTGFVWVYYQK